MEAENDTLISLPIITLPRNDRTGRFLHGENDYITELPYVAIIRPLEAF